MIYLHLRIYIGALLNRHELLGSPQTPPRGRFFRHVVADPIGKSTVGPAIGNI
jgi:hypothetical protein